MVLILISFYNFKVVNGMGTKGDNVSYLLNSFQEGYDRRLRPNYGGMSWNAVIKSQQDKISCF